MFRNNTNIIGFLQKKQFFNRSPSPSPSTNSRFATNPAQRTTTPPKSPKYESNKSNPRTIAVNKKLFDTNYQHTAKGDIESAHKAIETMQPVQKPAPTAQRTSRTFQSSRVQVKMCIEELSSKIAVELRLLQGAITELTVSLESIFYKKLSELRQELDRSIDQVFAQARSNLNNLVTSSNEKHLKNLLKCKHHLSDADRSVKELKTALESNWRKAAAEMFSSNFDQKIESILEESEQVRKGLDHRAAFGGLMGQETGWEAIRRDVSGLIERRCR